MWKKEVTLKTKASKESIWELWSDVENWNKWDSQTEYSSLEGDFVEGTPLLIKPAGAPKSKCNIIEVEKNKRFVVNAPIPLSKMLFSHEMNEKDGELYITHTVEISGPLTFIFSRMMGKNFDQDMKKAMENLIKMAEAK